MFRINREGYFDDRNSLALDEHCPPSSPWSSSEGEEQEDGRNEDRMVVGGSETIIDKRKCCWRMDPSDVPLIRVGLTLFVLIVVGFANFMRMDFSDHQEHDYYPVQEGYDEDKHVENEEKKPFGKCETEGCHKAAKELKSMMNLSLDPCEDFYGYVCGSYHVDPQGDNETSIFKATDKLNLQVIQEYLDGSSQFQFEPIVEGRGAELALNFYQSCVHPNNTGRDTLVSVYLNKTTTNGKTKGMTFHQDLISSLLIQLKNNTGEIGSVMPLICTSLTHRYFPDVTSHIFLSRTSYNSEKQLGILTIMEEVYDTYKSLIGRIPWLGTFARDYVILENLKETKHVAGYPEELFTKQEKRDKERYGSLEISREGSKFVLNFWLLELKFGGNKNSSIEDLLISKLPFANAFYQLRNNLIYVPAGISRDPLYNPGHPDLINYAKLGSILGHEFSHAVKQNFDLYDLGGLIPPQDKVRMKEKEDCVKDRYETFQILDYLNTFNWTERNGTVEEDVADILGSYVALKTSQKIWEGGNYQVLPGLEDFKPEQIFFIASAQNWCQSFKNEGIKRDVLQKQIVKDDHSPPSIRVLGAMSSSDEFAEAFSCPRGSKYNPVKKCRFFD